MNRPCVQGFYKKKKNRRKKIEKKLFKILGIAFVFTVSLFVLTSCTKGLPAPTNVHINEHGVLVWDSVENAKGYKVLINDTEYDTTTPSYDLIKLNLPVGIHTIKVKAISNSKDFKIPNIRIRFLRNYRRRSKETFCSNQCAD